MCKKDIIKIMKYDDKNDKHMKSNDIKKLGDLGCNAYDYASCFP